MSIAYLILGDAFDSELSRPPDRSDNGTVLTLVIKVGMAYLDQPTVKNPSGVEFKAEPWTAAAKTQFFANFKRRIEGAWNDRFYIRFPDQSDPVQAMNKADYLSFLDPVLKASKPPYLTCRVRIEEVSVNCHLAVMCFNLSPGQGYFGAQYFPPAGPGVGVIRVGSDGVQIQTRTNDFSAFHETYRRSAVAHELGHFFGWQHVNASNAYCKSIDSNDEICYGTTYEQQRDIMGLGGSMQLKYVYPWMKAIRLHTGQIEGWKASFTSPPLDEILR